MIEFKHVNRQQDFPELPSYTFVMDTPDHVDMEMLALDYIEGFDDVKLHFGVAKVHPDDQYVKSVGREIALQNMQAQDFRVISVHVDKHSIYMKLVNNEFEITLCSSRKAKKYAKFVGVEELD